MAAPAPRFATAPLVEPILREVARSLLEERSALLASPLSSPPPPEGSSAAAAAGPRPRPPPPEPFLPRYPRDPRDAQAFASELSQRVLSRVAALALPYKWAASCSLAARAGGGTAVAAAGVFEEGDGGGREGEDEQKQEEEGRNEAAGPRCRQGGDSLCTVLVEEGGVAVTVTAAWVRCL